MIAIDADSHFTIQVQLFDEPPQLKPEIASLVDEGRLSFGHWEIDEQHDSYVVLLRSLRDHEVERVFLRLEKATHDFFRTKKPDLVIFPADSTAIHLASRFASKLGSGQSVVIASPAFRSYGNHSLRLELTEQHLAPLRGRSEINVLFFDDSLSSGDTEMHALKALARMKKLLPENAEIRWLTFVVLWRGQRRISFKNRPKPKVADENEYKYSFDAYGIIGPESLGRSVCPLCQASKRIRQATFWTVGARPAVRQLLERFDELLKPRPIERLLQPTPCVDRRIAHYLLRLTNLRMGEASIFIWRSAVQEDSKLPIDQLLASLLYVAINFNDVGSYISWEDTQRLIKKSAERVNFESQQQRDALLLGLATFPPSVVKPIITHLVDILARAEAVDLVAAVMAMVFSSEYHAFLDNAARDVQRNRSLTLQDHRRGLIQEIKQLTEINAPIYGNIKDIIAADLNAVAFPPREDNPIWVARTLSALLHKGGHPSFLSDQIENLSTDTANEVLDGLVQALKLIECLPASAIDHLMPRIQELKEKLRQCSRLDVEDCRNIAKEIIDDLWEQLIHTKYFNYPRVLLEHLKDGVIAVVSKFHGSGVKTENILVLPCDEVTLDCEIFTPSSTILVSHEHNLLMNPFKHYPLEEFKNDCEAAPLAIAYLKIDSSQENLLLVVADRARPPVTENLWTLKRGLSNVRATMQIFGGDVEHIDLKKHGGLFGHNYSPTEPQIQFIKQPINPKLYQNLFVTAFPLVRRSL